MVARLYIVHCIDTEGPLHEPLTATFERLHQIYGIELEASSENLEKIQNRKLDLKGIENDIAKSFSKHLLSYNDSWDKIDAMLDKIMSREYRSRFPDSEGNEVVYNWHCMDNVGFTTNERRRDLGYGNVFRHYQMKIREHGSKDLIHWHFHPLSFNREGHICNTCYDNSYPLLHQILCRRLCDHGWFPVVNRAGFHAIRQDSSFFLEQWIPFDYSNQSMHQHDQGQADVYRYGDWRRAPKVWRPYNPSHDDYQSVGTMNRYTTKCLNIGTRFNLLDDAEVNMAFRNADEFGGAILAFTNHDFRDMSLDIEDIYSRISRISGDYPNVKIVNSDAISAMQKILFDPEEVRSNRINLELEIDKTGADTRLIVHCTTGKVFGSQPYLAIKTKEGRYYHDNFNEFDSANSWSYIFDRASVDISMVDTIAVAANDKYGQQSVITHTVS